MAPTHTPARSDTGKRAGLDRDDIVDAALALVEANGPGALTMRKLAAELDVTTTTIYWHIGGRDELVGAVIRRLSEHLAERAIEGDTAADRVVHAALCIWDSALTNRHVTALAHREGASSLLALPMEITLLRELEVAGLHGVAARDAHQAILLCVAGFLVIALRPERAVPLGYRSEALWAEVAPHGITDATLRAQREPAELASLLPITLRAIVDAALRTVQETP
jgi:TetR/AcrR family tetracycline transcriptional repressor